MSLPRKAHELQGAIAFRDLQERLSYSSKYSSRPTIVYFSPTQLGKEIDDTDVQVLYNCLKSTSYPKSLALVLNTPGGNVDAARRALLHLKEVAGTYETVVDFAASAGTLLAIGSEKIILTSTSRLTPADPILKSSSNSSIQTISSEDIRTFCDMAKEWFDISLESSRVKILEALVARVPPTTLSRLFRAEKHMLELLTEILTQQLPNHDRTARHEVARKLISGYHSHTHSLIHSDLILLGLNVEVLMGERELILSNFFESCRWYIKSNSDVLCEDGCYIDCIIFSPKFFARHISPIDSSDSPFSVEPHWEVLQ